MQHTLFFCFLICWYVHLTDLPVLLLCSEAVAQTATLLKKKLWRRCFPVNFVKFLRTRFLQNTSGGCFCYVVRTSFYFETPFSTQPINLVLEEISRNKSVVQASITCSINQIEKNVSIRHSSVLALMKSGAPFFRIDIM